MRVMLSWIGHTDLKAMVPTQSKAVVEVIAKLVRGNMDPPKDGMGPVRTLVAQESFDKIIFFNNYDNKDIGKGLPINKSHIYRMLNNVKYIGKVAHKGQTYNGEHPALIDQATWDKVHAILAKNTKDRAAATRFTTPAMLKGIIRCGHCGCSMRPGWTKKNGKKYRYYVCINMDKRLKEDCPVRRVSAAKAEETVMRQLRAILQQPEIVAHTARADAVVEANLTEGDVRRAFQNVDAVWEHLFPVEQARIVGLLFESIAVGTGGIDMTLKSNGVTGLMAELTVGCSQKSGTIRKAAS